MNSIVKANCPDCMNITAFQTTETIGKTYDADIFVPLPIVNELDGKSQLCLCKKMIYLKKNSNNQLDTSVNEGQTWG